MRSFTVALLGGLGLSLAGPFSKPARAEIQVSFEILLEREGDPGFDAAPAIDGPPARSTPSRRSR